jgi:hypothetical protein
MKGILFLLAMVMLLSSCHRCALFENPCSTPVNELFQPNCETPIAYSQINSKLMGFFLKKCALTCRSEYLYPKSLASYQINTPDPNRACYYGQQIIVKWHLTSTPISHQHSSILAPCEVQQYRQPDSGYPTAPETLLASSFCENNSTLGLPLLLLKIRYVSREIEEITVPICKLEGWYVHKIVNDAYWGRGGVLSFKAEIIQNGVVLADWSHFLWADLIEIGL